jgi:hypothetical protein
MRGRAGEIDAGNGIACSPYASTGGGEIGRGSCVDGSRPIIANISLTGHGPFHYGKKNAVQKDDRAVGADRGRDGSSLLNAAAPRSTMASEPMNSGMRRVSLCTAGALINRIPASPRPSVLSAPSPTADHVATSLPLVVPRGVLPPLSSYPAMLLLLLLLSPYFVNPATGRPCSRFLRHYSMKKELPMHYLMELQSLLGINHAHASSYPAWSSTCYLLSQHAEWRPPDCQCFDMAPRRLHERHVSLAS